MEESLSGMEQTAGISDLALMLDRFMDLPSRDWSQYSPLTLAWIGDTVYDLIVRTVLLKRANMQTDKLHRMASALVNARAQAKRMKEMSREGRLNDDTMLAVMSEQKKPEEDKIVIPCEAIAKYFPRSTTPHQMERMIYKLLSDWQKKKQRQHGAR